MGSKKGFYVSYIAAAVSVGFVVVVLVAEGLLLGLLGRPTCNDEVVTPTASVPISTTTTDPGSGVVWENPRLPSNLKPIDYSVSLRPVLANTNADGMYAFYGSSSTRYTCESSTEYVLMHAINLEFSDQWSDYLKIVDKADNSEPAIVDVMFYQANAYIVVTLESPCVEGHIYEISFSDFWGELGEDHEGLYRSEYENENGEKRSIALTQMQVDGARQTFPCFDEPAFKANFNITIFHQQDLNHHAISNMPPVSHRTEMIEGVEWTATTFDTTPTMSTYLLAMVVSDFECEEALSEVGIQARAYARKVPIDDGEASYITEMASNLIRVYAEYLNVSYSLPKFDQLVVRDFDAGSMGNWGLIVTRESYSLYNETATSVFYKYSTVQVIAREIAHQWFGNLVTPAWWSDEWLSEGLAGYFQYIGINGVRPDWKSGELFVIYDFQRALASDASSSSHPLHNPEGYLSRINRYKGSSFVRMVQHILGEKTFSNALKKYVEGQKYGVATSDVLFQYLIDEAENDGSTVPYDLQEVFETWILQMGYPLLTLTKNNDVVTVTQEYFLIDENDSPVSTPGSNKYNYKWYVPFNYKFSSSVEDANSKTWTEWLSPTETSSTINLINGSEYILGNIDAKGYYRVVYDDEMWTFIIEKMRSPSFKDISPENRAQLIDDVFAITRSGRVSVESALNLTLYLSQELDYIPWYTFYDVMLLFDRLLAGSTVYGDLRKYMVSLIEPSIYKEYGWNDTDTSESLQVERMLKGRVLDGACYFGLEDCNDEAIRLYREWMNNPSKNTISTTYRKYVYCFAIREGGEDEWNFAWQQYLQAERSQDQRTLRIAMSCSRISWILTRYLEYCLDPSVIRRQDAAATMSYVGDFEEGKYVAWTFAVNNWDRLMSTVGSDAVKSMLDAASGRLSTEFDLQLIESLRPIAESEWTNTLNSYHDRVVENIKWRAKNEPLVRAWLKAKTFSVNQKN